MRGMILSLDDAQEVYNDLHDDMKHSDSLAGLQVAGQGGKACGVARHMGASRPFEGTPPQQVVAAAATLSPLDISDYI